MGWEVEILSDGRPSRISGAQYLHSPIPELTGDVVARRIDYVRYGSEAGYSEKIYGRDFDPKMTSWSKFPDSVLAYPLPPMYERLVAMYGDMVAQESVTPWMVPFIVKAYDAVFSTIPRQCITANHADYAWHSEDCVVVEAEAQAYKHGLIIYNGERGTPWYRFSSLWGHASYEFPRGFVNTDGKKAVTLTKPVSTDAPAPDGVHLLGRYGKWRKGVLVDHAFSEAMSILKSC